MNSGFLCPDSSSGCTEGEGQVVQLFKQEWQEQSLFTEMAGGIFFFWSETRWWLKMQILKLYLKLTESGTVEVGHSNIMFLRSPSGDSDFKFETHIQI